MRKIICVAVFFLVRSSPVLAGIQGIQTPGVGASLSVTTLTITAMTSGSVLFSTTSGQVSQNNSNFFWDNDNVRLGIGLASPTYPFQIRGVSTKRPHILMQPNASNGTAGALMAEQSMFRTDAIATNFSMFDLLVYSTNTANPAFRVTNHWGGSGQNASSGTIAIGFYDDTAYFDAITVSTAQGVGIGNNLRDITGATLVVQSTSTTAAQPVVAVQNNAASELFRIQQNGRLGLATSGPATLFHMSSGTLTIDGNGTPGITLTGANVTATGSLGYLSSQSSITTSGLLNGNNLTVTNPVTVANGGTGATTLTSNGVLYGNGTGVAQVTAQGPANSVLTANAGAPSFSATPTLTSLTAPTLIAPLTVISGTVTFTQNAGITGTSPNFRIQEGGANQQSGIRYLNNSGTSLWFIGTNINLAADESMEIYGYTPASTLVYLDQSNGNVNFPRGATKTGLGTNTPATKLHMSSGTLTIDGTSPAVNIGTNTLTANTALQVYNNRLFNVGTNGFLGIGVAANTGANTMVIIKGDGPTLNGGSIELVDTASGGGDWKLYENWAAGRLSFFDGNNGASATLSLYGSNTGGGAIVVGNGNGALTSGNQFQVGGGTLSVRQDGQILFYPATVTFINTNLTPVVGGVVTCTNCTRPYTLCVGTGTVIGQWREQGTTNGGCY